MNIKKRIVTLLTLIYFPLLTTAANQSPDEPQIIPRYSMEKYDEEIQKIYAANPNHPKQSIESRIAIYSRVFLGQPYLGGALGEGEQAQFDKSPLYRTDAFDCTTYAATIIALAQGNNVESFKKNIIKINYKDTDISYQNRNHFAEVDWNYKNQYNGYLRDITYLFVDDAGNPVAKIAQATIAKPAWFSMKTANTIKVFEPISAEETKKLMTEFQAISKSVQNEESVMLYLPLTALYNAQGAPNMALFNQIPDGSLIQLVRPNWDLTDLIGTHMNISHMGFGLRDSRGLIFRDVSTITETVRDIPLVDYLKSYLESPTIKGINIQKITTSNP